MSCHGNYAFYIAQTDFYNTLFYLGGPLNNLACMRKYPKGARSDYEPPHLPPPLEPPDSFYVIFPLFLDFIYVHEYAYIGPPDEWTCQIVSLLT